MSSFLDSKSTLIEAINAIEKNKKRIAIVLDENKKLMGTLTDGDVRRCLLHGGDLKTEVCDAMNRFPISAKDNSSPEDLFKLMQNIKKLLHLLSYKERKRASLLLIMILLMAFIDMLGIASILPFIAILTSPEIIDSNTLLNKVYKASKLFCFY